MTPDADARRTARASAAIESAHAAAIAAGAPGYLDPVSGLFVFTAASLAEHGACCDSGCRHCPYGGPRDVA